MQIINNISCDYNTFILNSNHARKSTEMFEKLRLRTLVSKLIGWKNIDIDAITGRKSILYFVIPRKELLGVVSIYVPEKQIRILFNSLAHIIL